MSNLTTPDSLTDNDLLQRDAFIAKRRAARTRAVLLVSFVILTTIMGVFFIAKSHRDTLAANAIKVEQENQRAQARAAAEAAAKAERDFQAAYAGRLEAWETILGDRNPIKGWPVRRREVILADIASKESEIEDIRSQMRAATTQNSYAYTDSYGGRGSGTSNSYNAEEMSQLRQKLAYATEELFLLQTELRRDEYFQGRIAGHNL